jgi:putative PIN family toxin of toxin-antitoxin system
MRIVLDANVIVAAFAARGLCESVMEVCLSEHEIVLSEELLHEILKNLLQKIKLPSAVVDGIGELLREHANMLNPVPIAPGVCRDPDDVKVLSLALASKADCIVTGDKDLLVLKKFEGIPILSPRSFSDILHETEHL